jgi:hypothetical protein
MDCNVSLQILLLKRLSFFVSESSALLALMLLPLHILSQDLTGIWTGTLQTSGSDLPYEIVITNDGGKLTGYSLTIFNIDGVENVGIKTIRLKNKQGSILIEDEKLIYNNYVTTSRRVKLLGEMLLRVHDTVMSLNGTFHTRSLDFRERSSLSFRGTISLTKLNTPQETKLISTLEEMNLLNTAGFSRVASSEAPVASGKSPVRPESKREVAAASAKSEKPSRRKRRPVEDPKEESAATKPPSGAAAETQSAPDTVKAAAELATRETEIIQNVFFKSDSLVLKLYDHGVIDGDTVSVVLNGKVIVARQGLKGKPLVSVIHITPSLGDSLLLVMYAESLGSIPPNTGILIVQDGDSRYEIRFEGTKQKSSAILLTRKRK